MIPTSFRPALPASQVADIPVDHPSTSKQHAVLQFRQVTERNEFGDTKSLTKYAPLPPSRVLAPLLATRAH